ncbi:hypothetical protein AB0M92_19200 [Streptomyces sp. NPDC051582]|uniref:hypothetical protein n=1 Tax=Streptomyces sp. NPDC051582 TaxID=3155167 RepID=UPI003435E6F1
MITCKCGEPAVVQWKRRPTSTELNAARAAETSRRASAAASGPAAPDLPPLSPTDSTIPVYACADHALTPALASLVHQAACAGPDKNGTCPCTPEPAPAADFPDDPTKPKRRLPKGW